MDTLVSDDPSGNCIPCEDFVTGCVTPCYGVSELANTYLVTIVYFTDDCATGPGTPQDPITLETTVTRTAPDACGWNGTSATVGPTPCPEPLTDGRYFRARVTMFPDENGWDLEIAIDARALPTNPWTQQGDLCTFVRDVPSGTGPVGAYVSESCTTEEFFDAVDVS